MAQEASDTDSNKKQNDANVHNKDAKKGGNDKQLNEERETKKMIVTVDNVNRNMLLYCFEQNDFQTALPISKLLLDKATKEFGAESAETWSASMEYIEVHKRLKNDKEALKLYLELKELTMKLFGNDDENTASIYNNIAMLYYHTFEHSKSIPYFKGALGIWEKIYPENDQKVIVTRNNIFVNQQMAVFDVEAQKHGVKIEKMDWTRDLQGRKPQNEQEIDDQKNAENDNTPNDPEKMAAFNEAIDHQFGKFKVNLNKDTKDDSNNNKDTKDDSKDNNEVKTISNNNDKNDNNPSAVDKSDND